MKKILAILAFHTLVFATAALADNTVYFQSGPAGQTGTIIFGKAGEGTQQEYYIDIYTPLGLSDTAIPADLVVGMTLQQIVDEYSPVPFQLP